MGIEFDPAKDAINIAKHGVSLAFGAELFADPGDPEDFDVSEEAIELALAERRKRGAQRAPTKLQLTVRLDPDVVAYYKAGGQGWQSRMNADLRTVAGLPNQ